jgi:hypothetical protein
MVGVMWKPMASLSLASSPRCHTGFLSIGSRLCSRASFRPRLTTTPLHFANPSPPSGRVEDFHLQTVVHARHTMKGPGGMPGPFRLAGKPAAQRSTVADGVASGTHAALVNDLRLHRRQELGVWDGKADISGFRPSDGQWYRTNSGNGSFFAFPFGVSGDKPTQSAFQSPN